MKFIDEFKQFATRGNLLDLAVGIIIGSAFGKIVSSLVADIIMPPIGLLIGGVNFTELKIVLNPHILSGGLLSNPVTINYGNFLQTIFDFIIIAFAIFMMIKFMNNLTRKREAEPTAPATPPPPAIPPGATRRTPPASPAPSVRRATRGHPSGVG